MEKGRNKLETAILAALACGAIATTAAQAQDYGTLPATNDAAATSRATGDMHDGRVVAGDQAMEADQGSMNATSGTSPTQPPTAAAPGTTTSRSSSTATTNTGTQSQTTRSTAGGSNAYDSSRMDSSTGAANDYDQSRPGNASAGSGQQGGGGSDVIWFVMPVAMESQGDRMSNGCWVRLYSGDKFEGRYVAIFGPTSIREMRSPYGTGLNNWESAVVGPNATVTTYDDEDFRSRNATLRAGQRYPDLDDSKLGLFDDIESLKVACANGAGSSSGS